jgi:hypothetical protein
MQLRRSTLLILFLSGLQTGCMVGRISPSPPASHDLQLQNALKRVVLGIADADSNEQRTTARRLQFSLQESGLFQKVAMMSELNQKPDLILDSYEGTKFGFPVGFQCFEPYLPVLTLGIFPQTCEEDIDVSFKLRRPHGRAVSLGHQHFKESSVSGWVALPMNLSPEWHSERSLQRNLWLSVCQSRQSEILSILR